MTMIKQTALFILKTVYGYLFGLLVWFIIIHPYDKYIDLYRYGYTPQFLFASCISVIFVLSLWARTTMVLFLPSMVGNATQNYIIVLLFISLCRNPINNVAQNSIESVRVIGCSLTMTFEQLKERAKLILNPIIEVFTDTNQTDLEPIRQDLNDIKSVILEMRRDTELSQNQQLFHSGDTTTASLPLSIVSSDKLQSYNASVMAVELAKKFEYIVEHNNTEEIAQKMKDLIETSSVELKADNLGFRASLDQSKLESLLRSSGRVLSKSDWTKELNLSQIMHDNCYVILEKAKSSCSDVVAFMRHECEETMGVVLSSVFCPTFSFAFKSICPWLFDQMIDEENVCKKIQLDVGQLRIDPFNLTNRADAGSVYRNLTKRVDDLDKDLFLDKAEQYADSMSSRPRLEINIDFNNATKRILLTAKGMVDFVREKYRIRQIFYDTLSFIYEIYTTLTFALIMTNSWTYLSNYLRNIKFDNSYITRLFTKLDRRRAAQDKKSVLPLTKEESETYITTLTCKRRTGEERDTQCVSCVVVLVFLALVGTLLYVDNILYSILESIRKHALVIYEEAGLHQLNVIVVGEGSLARLVRKILTPLNSFYRLDRMSNTSDCLPNPVTVTSEFYMEFFYLTAGYIIIDQLSIYAMRFRRVTAAFFYPDREKKRVKYLHELILYRRRLMARAGYTGQVVTSVPARGGICALLDSAEGSEILIKDAIDYLRGCVAQSICCRRHPIKNSPTNSYDT